MSKLDTCLEFSGRCQGSVHKVSIFILDGTVTVECPDHDFELDEVEESFGSAPRNRRYCNAIHEAWHGMKGVSLDTIHECLSGAKTHGLTSKAAKRLLGAEVSQILYSGVRSVDFAKSLVACGIFPVNVPFDVVASERFVTQSDWSTQFGFYDAAIAGGIGMLGSDIEWIIERKITLGYVNKALFNPRFWQQLDPDRDRYKLISWWRKVRHHMSSASGELVVTFISNFPIHLERVDQVTKEELETFVVDGSTEYQNVTNRLIQNYQVYDLPTLLEVRKSQWTVKKINQLNTHDLMIELKKLRSGAHI